MQKLPEVNLKKSFNLVDEKVSCPASGVLPPFDAAVTVDVEASMVLNITLAISAVGTMVRTLPLRLEFTHLLIPDPYKLH
jgi:hypothetical protein